MSKCPKCLALTLITITAMPVQAAHWEQVSFTDLSYSSTANIFARTARSTITATMPGGSVYGTGPFKFYGESSGYSIAKQPISNPGTFFYSGHSSAYYTFVYKWVADSPNDIPPTLYDEVEVSGYSLEKARSSLVSSVDTGVAGIWAWNVGFNSQGPLWGGSGFPTPAPNQHSHLEYWPQATDSPVITIGSDLFYVRPVALGGGPVTLDGSGNLIVTFTVLNTQSYYHSTPYSSPDPIPIIKATISGSSTCYKGAAKIMGLPVQ